MAEVPTTTEVSPQDLSEVLLQPEVQKSLAEMLQYLPKLTPLLGLAVKGVDVAREAITDKDMMAGLEEVILEKARPLQTTFQDSVSIMQEAKRRAEQNHSYIGVFGMLRMLKDPNVQYSLHYMQALCDVIAERRNSKNRSPVQ